MTHTDLIKGDTMTENWNPEPFEGTWTEAAVNRIQRVRELCERSRVAISRGCTCYTNECSGCGYGTPLAWDLDPVEVLAVLDEICT